MAGFTISITGYSMHLIQVDGGGEVVDSNDAAFVGIVYPGERVDIIVERIPWHEESKSAIMIELDPEYDSMCDTVLKISVNLVVGTWDFVISL
jgi:hypothetical protein